MAKKYDGKSITVLRDALPGDGGYDDKPVDRQVLIKLADNTECVVWRSQINPDPTDAINQSNPVGRPGDYSNVTEGHDKYLDQPTRNPVTTTRGPDENRGNVAPQRPGEPDRRTSPTATQPTTDNPAPAKPWASPTDK